MSELTLVYEPPVFAMSYEAPQLALGFGNPVAREYVERNPYTGAYEVTPSAETQTLLTDGLRMTDNVVINPIPNNYGLITWNGSVITVS